MPANLASSLVRSDVNRQRGGEDANVVGYYLLRTARAGQTTIPTVMAIGVERFAVRQSAA
jgi:hypothetical protein